jgi:TIR domain-containing protein
MPTIFINFRNGDGEWAAEALRVVLEQRFGKDHVFLSHKSIPVGAPWPDALLENARSCDVFLALIGPNWLTITGEDGRPRIFADDDWVRREIAAALAAGRAVTPILLGDTPRLDLASDLPDDIRDLACRQGPRLDVRRADDDYAGLERRLMDVVPSLRKRPSNITANTVTKVKGSVTDSDISGVSAPLGVDGIDASSTLEAGGDMTRVKHRAVDIRDADQGKGTAGSR